MNAYTFEEVKAMNKEERKALREEADMILTAYHYVEDNDITVAEYDAAYGNYMTVCDVNDLEYRDENMEEFLAYEKTMHDPNFDWQYYSDWHKDMWGFRPRWNTIPETEGDRYRMYEQWRSDRDWR